MLYAVALLKRDRDPERQSRRLDVIERQAAHMVRLVDDLLDVSRISRGVLELKREAVDIAPLLVQAVEAATPGLEAGRHQFSLHAPARAAVVNADPTRIVQIVTNLLNNAAKYTPDAGEIRLSAAVQDSVVIVEVVDSGLGIPREDQSRLFDLFTQLPHTGGKTHGGLGIGLSLVKSLVEMHDGKVDVQSAGLNQGSTFRIELPLAAATTMAPETGTDTTPTARSGRVLVVEDNSDGLRTLVELLEAHGYAVGGAADGPEALRLAGELKPELVLLDLGLPGMNGYEVATHLRRDVALANMRIVALTGWGTQGDRAKTTAAGFDGHINKPVAPAKLLELVGGWLQPVA